jgi:Hexokinase
MHSKERGTSVVIYSTTPWQRVLPNLGALALVGPPAFGNLSDPTPCGEDPIAILTRHPLSKPKPHLYASALCLPPHPKPTLTNSGLYGLSYRPAYISLVSLTCSLGASITAPPDEIPPLIGSEKLASSNPRSSSPVATHDRSVGYSARPCQKRHTKPGGPTYSPWQLLSAFVVLVVLIVQFWHTSPSPPLRPKNHPLTPFGDNVRRQEAYFDQLEPGTQCKPRSLFSSELPYSQVPTNMALVERAKQIAAEFEYPTEEVRKGVKEFIREMDEGLEKQGTTMSQIPSYVTAVPNGTEKVALQIARL